MKIKRIDAYQITYRYAEKGKYSACFQIFKNSSGHEPKNLLQEEA